MCIAANVVRLRSLVCPDKSSPSGDKSEIDEVILSLPLQLQPQKSNTMQANAINAAKKHSRTPKKNSKQAKRMSKKQKLLRKRVEAEKLRDEDEEDDSKVNVKVKYSVNYLYWAVSSDEEDENESEVETTVVLPLKSLRLK